MAFIRDNKNIVKGDELWLFIGTSTTTKPICFSTSHQLSRSLSTSSVVQRIMETQVMLFQEKVRGHVQLKLLCQLKQVMRILLHLKN